MYTNPTVEDFKNYFVRDFPFGDDPNENILDADISRALDEVVCQINPALFCSQQEYKSAYLLLAAHNLCMNIKASSQGLNGSFSFLTSSKSVGSVSISKAIPNDILNNPMFAWLTTSNYGAKYLMMIYPRLIGNMSIVMGGTQP